VLLRVDINDSCCGVASLNLRLGSYWGQRHKEMGMSQGASRQLPSATGRAIGWDMSRMKTVRDREVARLRAMTAAEKLRVTEALWREARTITEAAIVSRHPEWTRDQVRQETRRVMSGGRA
jgi:hypothetical protein